MKSKEEILKGVLCCLHPYTPCKECPYDEYQPGDCFEKLIPDLQALFNKSDFEVVEEVLTRSKNQDWFGTGYQGGGYELERLDNVETPPIMFDGEGNIL